jgi:DNA-binding transcriptional ArsR family regulator
MNVGEAQHHLGVPASTLAHHLATLARAGLVSQERQGRSGSIRSGWRWRPGCSS